MSVSLITFTVWRRLELIAENILPVCMILCYLWGGSRGGSGGSVKLLK